MWIKTAVAHPSNGAMVIAFMRFHSRKTKKYVYTRELSVFRDGSFYSKWNNQPLTNVHKWRYLEDD